MKCPICRREIIVEEVNPLVNKYICPDCRVFYVEKAFLGLLDAFKTRYGAENYEKILREMRKMTLKAPVAFVVDFTKSFYDGADATFIELEDLIGLARVKTFDINSPFDYGS